MPRIGVMRKLRGEEHAVCMCGGIWTGNGYTRMVSNKLLEHLICTRCGYRCVTDHRSIRAGFAIPQDTPVGRLNGPTRRRAIPIIPIGTTAANLAIESDRGF